MALVLSTRTMTARVSRDRRTLHWLSLWVMTREAASGSVSLGPQDHHGTYQQPREIRSHRQSWTTTKSLILARSGMAGRAASCQPYSAEMRCRRIRFETCHCRRRASIMPRAFQTIELMTCESMTRLLCSTSCLVLRSLIRFHNWQLLHPQNVVSEICPPGTTAWRRIKMLPSSCPRWHCALASATHGHCSAISTFPGAVTGY